LDVNDAASVRKHEEDMQRSEAAAQANVQRQQEIWQQIDALQQELQRLASSREREIEWQLDEHRREAQRREDHKWAHKVAGEHKRRLEMTLRYCEGALRCVGAADSLVSDGALAAQRRHEQLAQELAQTKVAVLAEKEQELARLQQWGGEHRVTVAHTLHDVQSTSPLPSGRHFAQIAAPGRGPSLPIMPAGSPDRLH